MIFDYYTLRANSDNTVDVFGWGEYPEPSVLAGQTAKVYMDTFDNEAAAKPCLP